MFRWAVKITGCGSHAHLISTVCIFFRHLRVFSRQHSSAEDLVETAGRVSLVTGLVGAYIRHRGPPLPAKALRKRSRRGN